MVQAEPVIVIVHLFIAAMVSEWFLVACSAVVLVLHAIRSFEKMPFQYPNSQILFWQHVVRTLQDAAGLFPPTIRMPTSSAAILHNPAPSIVGADGTDLRRVCRLQPLPVGAARLGSARRCSARLGASHCALPTAEWSKV